MAFLPMICISILIVFEVIAMYFFAQLAMYGSNWNNFWYEFCAGGTCAGTSVLTLMIDDNMRKKVAQINNPPPVYAMDNNITRPPPAFV